MSEQNGVNRRWDHEDCPEDGCNGELQEQDNINVMCLSCEAVYTHGVDERGHFLGKPGGEPDVVEVVVRE